MKPATRNILIDTDGATDDMRAITLMLADPRIEVLGITCVDGVLPPEDCSRKVASLLRTFHHEGIPVGKGEDRGLGEVKGRNFCQRFDWGEDHGGPPVAVTGAREIYQDIVRHSGEPFTLVCLGPLTNIAANLDLLKEKADKITWYCNGDSSRGQNFYCDRDAIPLVESSGIPVERIMNPDIPGIRFDEDLLQDIGSIQSRYARHLYTTHEKGSIRSKIREGFYGLWDELAPVYLLYPECFRKNGNNHFEPSDPMGIREAILTILEEGYPDNRGFLGFPEGEEHYRGSIGKLAREVIEAHGRKEWRAGVITNEMHGHIGIYALLGMKMGVRAREYFGVGPDRLSVVSQAGTKPPVSCLNDGIQVSTGATVGHGLLSVDNSMEDPVPAARFTCRGRTIELALKEEYAEEVRKDVAYGVKTYGLKDPRYWQHIEQLALRYWVEWSRHSIFSVEC